MSTYTQLRRTPPSLKVKDGVKEVVIDLVSCMCNNKYKFRFKKNSNNEFKLNTMGFAYSNYQIKHDTIELEWAADENEWDKVFEMINTGTSAIGGIRQR